jgi:MFS transporter, FSR family, fosmidomycin resistance protein
MSAHSNAIGSGAAPAALARPKVYLAVLLALGLSHLLNDTIQSLIPAVYPILKNQFALNFVQIGMITLTFQIAGALFQPVIGLYTDRHPLPYSTVVGMVFHPRGGSEPRLRIKLHSHTGFGHADRHWLVDLPS